MVIGCTGTESKNIVVDYNTTGVVVNNDNLTSNTTIVKEGKNLTVTGRVVKINFRNTGGDIIVFEDGYILPAYPARDFIWKIGGIHQIKMENFWGDYQIESVEIIEIDDKKQNVTSLFLFPQISSQDLN